MAKRNRPAHLSRPLEPLKIGLLASPEEIDQLTSERLAEKLRRLDQLREHFGIPPGPAAFALLALRLAEEHEPAFQERKSRGRPIAWSAFESTMLAGEMRRELDADATSEAEAARRLANLEPWATFLQARKPTKGDTRRQPADIGEALLTQYRSMDQRHRRVGEDAYRYHLQSNNDMQGWKALAAKILEGSPAPK